MAADLSKPPARTPTTAEAVGSAFGSGFAAAQNIATGVLSADAARAQADADARIAAINANRDIELAKINAANAAEAQNKPATTPPATNQTQQPAPGALVPASPWYTNPWAVGLGILLVGGAAAGGIYAAKHK